jgi:hypothetical protein
MKTNPVELFMRERGFTFRHVDGYHNAWPAPTFEQFQRARDRGTLPLLVRALEQREEAFRQWAEDPLDYGFEPETWAEADTLLLRAEISVLAAFGANRMSKSFWAAKRVAEAARAYPGATILVVSETEDSSKETAQKIIWHYYRKWLTPYNDDRKRHPVTKVNYTVANGFTDGKLVLPNASTVIFATYKEDPGKYEGLELGARVLELKTRADGRVIPNMGAWLDESAGLAWLEMVLRRVRYRRAKVVWAFTPIRGLTPAMKEFMGTPKITSDRPALYLPQARVPGCRPGHMPRTAVPAQAGGAVLWFHIGDNPFGSYTETVAQSVEGKASEIVERILYGYARDSVARAFPSFNQVHVVEPEQLPSRGRNYRICDPADARPFFVAWVRVCDGNLWFYRDWPSAQRFGEWAQPTEREVSADSRKGWDGDRGPAQNNLGLGVEGYKREWFKVERVLADAPPERDPMRRAIQLRLKPGESAQEAIHGNLIDPRAGPRKDVTDKGGTCLIWRFAEEHHTDSEPLPPIVFVPAPGLEVDRGIATINTLLEYNDALPLDPVTNAPHMYFTTECQQLLWGMRNFTGESGQEGACKDTVDCVRMAATSRLVTTEIKPGMERAGHGW